MQIKINQIKSNLRGKRRPYRCALCPVTHIDSKRLLFLKPGWLTEHSPKSNSERDREKELLSVHELSMQSQTHQSNHLIGPHWSFKCVQVARILI